MTDEELAIAYIDGNNRAFDELLTRCQDNLFGYIICMVKDEELANDLFQETFLKIITKMKSGRYTDAGKFSWWATRVAHNVIIDYFRANKNKQTIEPTKDNDLSNLGHAAVLDNDRESEMTNEQILKDVRHLVDALPVSQREVVYMRFYQELSFKEIASLTDVSINTSLGRMRYALINLRKLSKQHGVILNA